MLLTIFCGVFLQDKSKVIMSQLSLVDLAGSERAIRTNTTGDRLKEASNINKALLVLRTCMETLRDNQLNCANKVSEVGWGSGHAWRHSGTTS